MTDHPTLDELEREFGSALDNPGVLAVSGWVMPNNDLPFDEDEYLRRFEENREAFAENLKDLLSDE